MLDVLTHYEYMLMAKISASYILRLQFQKTEKIVVPTSNQNQTKLKDVSDSWKPSLTPYRRRALCLMNPFQRAGPLLPGFQKNRMIALDVFESPSQLCICLDLPGLKKEQDNMRIKDNILIISGDREKGEDAVGEVMPISERVFGSFERRVRLPNSVDLSKVDAVMENGVLEIKIGIFPCFKPWE
jgi:HSP20 family molecular chaperone IbpA